MSIIKNAMPIKNVMLMVAVLAVSHYYGAWDGIALIAGVTIGRFAWLWSQERGTD